MQKPCLWVVLFAVVSAGGVAGDGRDEGVELFNGKDLTGWVTGGENWKIIEQDHEPVLECFRYGPGVTFEKPVGDAVLDLWFKLAPGADSGIFFRGSEIVTESYPPPATSHEFQLYDEQEMWGHRTGDLLYAHRARRWASKPGAWNHATIISVGQRHKAYLNDQCVFDCIDTGAPLRGWICLQAHGGQTFFKRVRLKEITDGRWPEQTGRLKALLVVGGKRGIGERLDILGAIIERFLDDTGRFEITWTPEETGLGPPYLDYYDLIILYDNRSELALECRKRIVEFVQRGGGLVVLNRSTVGTFKTWSEFERIVGAAQSKGAWTASEPIAVNVTDPAHPITLGLKPFQIRDSFCRGVELARDARVVLATAGEKREPIGWVTRFGKGKVFCLALGQEPAALQNPSFARIMINAATWVAVPDPAAEMQRLVQAKDTARLAKLLHQPLTRADWPVIGGLAQLGTPGAADALANVATGRGDLLVRAAAVTGLGRIRAGSPDALHKLLLCGEPELIRSVAADALGARANAQSVEPLTTALGDPSGLVREKAIAALGRIRTPQAESALLAKLTGNDPWWYDSAVLALGRADSERTRAALVAIARGGLPRYRTALAEVAAALAAQMKFPEVFGAMAAILDSPDHEAYVKAARALAATKDPRVHDLFFPRVFGKDSDLSKIAEDYVRAAGKVDLDRYLSPYIRQWNMIGPFPNERLQGLPAEYPPQKELKLSAVYEGVDGPVHWQSVVSETGQIDLLKILGKRENVVAYAWVVIESPDDRLVQLRIGSDDGEAAWLNGQRVSFVNRMRRLTPDEDRVQVRLRKGRNVLLLKIAQGYGQWGFCARLGDFKGNAGRLKWSLPK